MMVVKKSYRDSFNSVKSAQAYRVGESTESYIDILWSIEKNQLKKIVREFRKNHNYIDYLDFATGKGRVISFMESLVEIATGIEISEHMAKEASLIVKSAKILCTDITNPRTPLEGRYDLITAFRFILNAEPELRLAALKALAARLKDETSWLVFNNHGYTLSYRLFAYPLYLLRRFLKGGSETNYLTHKQVLNLLNQSGLKVIKIKGYGVFSGKLTHFFSAQRTLALEEFASKCALSRLGSHQIYVAQLK